MESHTEPQGRPTTVREMIHGRLLTLREISEIYHIKYHTVRERYYKEGHRGLGLVDRTKRSSFSSDEDFIRACALRGHSQTYARRRLGWNIKQWYAIKELMEPLPWLPQAQTIENIQARARYSAQKAEERACNTMLHYRCISCGTRRILALGVVAETEPCEACDGSLRLDKQATAKAWGYEKNRSA